MKTSPSWSVGGMMKTHAHRRGGAEVPIFDMSGTVDMLDLTYFAENWLRQAW